MKSKFMPVSKERMNMGKLYVGVAREGVTPEIGGHMFGYNLNTFSTSVNDELNVTSLAFSYGETKFMMISATVCVICLAYCNEIREAISKELNIPFENILISAIHTHSGPSLADANDGFITEPEYYKNTFLPACVSASKKAMESIVPVKVGTGFGASYAGINRRQLMLDNKVQFGQNPWAPFNTEMVVISFKDLNDNVVANVISYSAHATAAGGNTEITRDWPGVMCDMLEEKSGGMTLFFNGTMGDSGPRLKSGGTGGTGIHDVYEIGKIAGNDAINIYNNIKEYKDTSIAKSSKTLMFPLKPRLPYEEVSEYVKSMEGKVLSHINSFIFSFYKKVKTSYENGYIEKEFKEIPQTVFRIGDVVFAPFPFEMFTEIAFRIDAEVKDLKVVTISYTNGQLLYLPTEDQLCRGGHEVNLFKYSNVQQYADNTDFYAVTETLKNIENLSR